MRIALAQINPTVGDIAGNRALIEKFIGLARKRHADIVVFPELAIVGYPPKDLLLKPALLAQASAAVHAIAASCNDIAAIIGYPRSSDQPTGRSLQNVAALCVQGRIVHHFVKTLLPTYDVFDEHRYFEPGSTINDTLAKSDNGLGSVATLGGRALGVSICEDLWNDQDVMPRQLYHADPVGRLKEAGANLLINAAASPFVIGKHAFRLRLLEAAAKRLNAPVVFCNQVGGNDELVFDGSSCAVNAQGRVVAQAAAFEEDLVVVDVDEATPLQASTAEDDADVASAYHALVLGLRDYCRKCGFKSVVMGLSGGIDSAVCCALAADALGAECVRGVAMPSRYSSDDSVADAKQLAENLNVQFDVIAIDEPHRAFEQTLSDVFAGLEADVTEENIQARIRGVILMAMSNKFGSMLVTTGNKSELAVGYCTLYGDMAGGLAILSDVPKTLVWRLAWWINAAKDSPLRQRYDRAVIPERSISKPPSAELRPDQTDQDSLPPYDVLDAIIERYVELEQSTPQIIAETDLSPELIHKIVRMIDVNEYKRKQAAPGLKITGRAFGFGRRMPIAQRFDNGVDSVL